MAKNTTISKKKIPIKANKALVGKSVRTLSAEKGWETRRKNENAEFKKRYGVDLGDLHGTPVCVVGDSTVDTLVPKNIFGQDRVIGLKTANEGINPKDRIGASKVDFTLIPTSAKVAEALALMDGATKYGPYNWRVEPVLIRTYLAAAERHLESFKEGELNATDSLIQHLGHVKACCSILIDALSQGTAIDDRPINGKGADIIQEANNWIKNDKPSNWGR